MKIGFDIGGVLSKYPKEFKLLFSIFGYSHNVSYNNLFIITDQYPKDEVIKNLHKNGIFPISKNIYCCDYEKYGNSAKCKLIAELKLDIFIDDFDGYLQWDSTFGPQPILLKVQPDMFKPYWHKDWICDSGDFGRRYFKRDE